MPQEGQFIANTWVSVLAKDDRSRGTGKRPDLRDVFHTCLLLYPNRIPSLLTPTTASHLEQATTDTPLLVNSSITLFPIYRAFIPYYLQYFNFLSQSYVAPCKSRLISAARLSAADFTLKRPITNIGSDTGI